MNLSRCVECCENVFGDGSDGQTFSPRISDAVFFGLHFVRQVISRFNMSSSNQFKGYFSKYGQVGLNHQM